MPPERFALLRRVLTGRLITALLQLFNGLGSWHRSDAQRFAAQAIPMVEGAQTALANLTSTYVASAASQALRTTVAPPAIPRGARLRLRQVDPQEVYERPFVEAYTALGDGKRLDEALGRARVRLREVAEGDMQQTYAESSRAAMQGLRENQRPTGHQRVLVGEVNCALCVVASTQLYRIETLQPLHPNCDCTSRPYYGEFEDRVIDPELLEKVHAAVFELTGVQDRGGRAVDYRKILTTMTHDHGELGPMLARPQDRFTTVADLPARRS